MNNLRSAEDAYHLLAQEILEFVGGRSWDLARGMYQILGKSSSQKWAIVDGGCETRKGEVPLLDASPALFYLRDNLLQTTGQRIWGLTFTLWPNGKFKIEYDYDKPEGYEESDEVITGDEINASLQKLTEQDGSAS